LETNCNRDTTEHPSQSRCLQRGFVRAPEDENTQEKDYRAGGYADIPITN
jgi:hypothetical protein